MTYSDKLRDPRWQRKRLEILQRDNFTCQICGATEKPLSVHHLIYRKKNPWEYDDECYQTLCDDCHEVRQELTDKVVDAIRMAIKNVPTQRLQEVGQRIFAEAMQEMNGE